MKLCKNSTRKVRHLRPLSRTAADSKEGAWEIWAGRLLRERRLIQRFIVSAAFGGKKTLSRKRSGATDN